MANPAKSLRTWHLGSSPAKASHPCICLLSQLVDFLLNLYPLWLQGLNACWSFSHALFTGLKVNPFCLSLLRFSIPSSGKPPSTLYFSFLHLPSGRYYLTLDQSFLVFKRVIHMFTQNTMRTPNEHLVHGEILKNKRSRE